MAGKRSTLYWVLGLFTLALVVRLVIIYPVRNDAPRSDPSDFDRIAWNLAQGRGFSMDGETPTAYRAPAFPMLLALVYSVFGRNWFIARLLTAIISALIAGIIYLTGRQLFNHKVGVISAVFVGIYPNFLFLVPLLSLENLFNFLLATVILLLIRIVEGQAQVGEKWLAGVCLGLAVMTRPEPILFLPFLLIWAFWISGFKVLDTLKLFLPLVLPTILLIALWTVRNYQVMNTFIPTTTGGGAVFRGVYNEFTFSDERLMGEWLGSRELPKWDELQKLPEIERDKARYRMAFEAIRNNLKNLPKLMIYKVHDYVFGSTIALAVARFPLTFLAFCGLTISWQIARRKCSIIYVLLLYYLVYTLIFYSNERFRTPVEPYIFMFAVFGAFEYGRFLARYKSQNKSDLIVAELT